MPGREHDLLDAVVNRLTTEGLSDVLVMSQHRWGNGVAWVLRATADIGTRHIELNMDGAHIVAVQESGRPNREGDEADTVSAGMRVFHRNDKTVVPVPDDASGEDAVSVPGEEGKAEAGEKGGADPATGKRATTLRRNPRERRINA